MWEHEQTCTIKFGISSNYEGVDLSQGRRVFTHTGRVGPYAKTQVVQAATRGEVWNAGDGVQVESDKGALACCKQDEATYKDHV